MKVKELSFGTINIDGEDYFKDIVIHKGKIEKRKKKKSKKFRSRFGHTPLSILENIPSQKEGCRACFNEYSRCDSIYK
jgi:hypothetical protein